MHHFESLDQNQKSTMSRLRFFAIDNKESCFILNHRM